MNRTVTARRPFAPVLMLASALALLVASVTPGLHPAAADQFTPLENPPSIDIVSDKIFVGESDSLDSEASGFTELLSTDAIQPASPRSTLIYNIFADLTTNGDLENVTEIRLCLYDSKDATFLASGGGADETAIEAECAIPAVLAAGAGLPAAPTGASEAWDGDGPDPKRVFVMRWLAADYSTDSGSLNSGFSTVGSNNYADAASLFTPAGQEATARFSFKVSNAMQLSDGWEVRIAAESQATISSDPQVKQSAQDAAGTFNVGYFATMETARTAADYEIVAKGVTVFRTGTNKIATGEFTANAVTVLTIAAGAFGRSSGGDDTIALDTTGDIFDENKDRSAGDSLEQQLAAMTNVQENRVSLDCAFIEAVTFVSGVPSDETELEQFIQVGTAARVFALGGSLEGTPRQTGEDAETLDAHSCMLNYGGGASTANVVYSNTVTVAPIQSTSPTLGD